MNRTNKWTGLLLLGSVLTGPLPAGAALVTWDMRGAITGATSGISDFPDAAIGDSFQVLLTFDTDAALIAADSGGRFAPGARYRYDPSSLRAVLVIGSSAPVRYAYVPSSVEPGFFYMRDNSGDLPSFSAVDGFSSTIPFVPPTGFASGSFTWYLRGSILDTINGPGLPRIPDPRLADQEDSGFFLAYRADQQDDATIAGDIASVSPFAREVPEPGTLALLGLGIAGLGFMRRRATA